MNTFAKNLNTLASMKKTENRAVAYDSTGSAVYDMFSLGGAYRSRSVDDRHLLFANAFDENPELALKCLFYLRDVRGGQGERQFFRDCFGYVLNHNLISYDTARNLLKLLPEYGRWDDVIYFYNKVSKTIDTIIINILISQLSEDLISEYPSLLAKWLPSENASNNDTKYIAKRLAKDFNMSAKKYRKTLSHLRNRIKVLERLMSENRWDEIEFDKIPSKAGYLYRNAFAEREETKERYEEFMSSKDTKVNSSTLYPYEIVKPCFNYAGLVSDREIEVMQKYWDNLPNYLTGKNESAICLVDVSGSMWGTPIQVATSLGVYCAERLKGAFNNLFITFSSEPKAVRLVGRTVYDKIKNMEKAEWGMSTNLVKAMHLILKVAKNSKAEDIPKALIIISDMEIDEADRRNDFASAMENVRAEFEEAGYTMPHMIYWNVDARHDTILDKGKNVTCVSGFSPVLFESVLSGKTGIEVMYDKLNSDRYKAIKIS